MLQSNDAVSDIILSLDLLTVSAPPETGPREGDKDFSASKIGYVHDMPA